MNTLQYKISAEIYLLVSRDVNGRNTFRQCGVEAYLFLNKHRYIHACAYVLLITSPHN